MRRINKHLLLAITVCATVILLSIGIHAEEGMKGDMADMTGKEGKAVATFAGGCFWCMEPPFDKLDGVISTTSGYIGGHKDNPTYKEVSAGGTGHAEAVEILYDPEKVTYGELLEVFWRQINPTTPDRQFVDIGSQYRAGIFYHDEEQRRLAEESKKRIAESGRFDGPIVTEITPASKFWPAEEYHQDYYRKNPIRYKYYRWGSGRDKYLESIWGGVKM